MSHSSRGFHSHTIGKTLLFLSVLKSQPPGIPSRKAGSLSSPRPPTPGRGKKKKNPTKKTTLGRDCLPRMDTKCTKELFEAPSKRASPGSGELPGCVGPRWADAGLGRARPFQSSRGGAKRGSPGAPRTQNKRPGRNAAPGRSPAPPALILRMGPLAGVFRGPEMQFSTPGKVTSAGARLGVGEGRAGGGGADPSSQRGPRPAGSPPLTLGLRLHPSPPAAREGGWPVAKGELAGLLRGWGPTGGRQGRGKGARDKKKKKNTRGLQNAPRKPAFQLPRLLREPGPGETRSHCTPPAPQKQKLQECTEEAPSPGLTQRLACSPPPSNPGREGEGSCHRRKKEARLFGEARRGQGQLRLPPPAPHRPARAAGPLSPRIMHGPGAPSALPPQEDTINVRGGPGLGKQERRGGWSPGRAPQGAGWRGPGRVGKTRCLEGTRGAQRPGSSSWEPPAGP